MKRAKPLLIAAALTVATLNAQATTIYDTIGPGNAYQNQHGWIVGNPNNGANYSPFAQFSPTQSGYLSSATAPVLYAQGEVAPIRFEIRTNENDQPGAVIAHASVGITAQGGLVSGSFLGDLLLSNQTTYWFGLATTDPTTFLAWYQNPVGVSGLQAFSGALWQQPGDWFVQAATLGAFQLDARVVPEVPEPSSVVLLILGFSLLAFRSVRSVRRDG